MEQKYCLHWNQYHVSLSQTLSNFRDNEELCDVTLVADDDIRFKAHRVVLAACSSFFKSMFLRQEGSGTPWIYLRGIGGSVISNLLEFIYLGEINIDQESLDEFLMVARELQVKGLSDSGYDLISENPSNVKDDGAENTAEIKDERVVVKVEPDYEVTSDHEVEGNLVITEAADYNFKTTREEAAIDNLDINSIERESYLPTSYLTGYCSKMLQDDTDFLNDPQFEEETKDTWSKRNDLLDKKIEEIIIKKGGVWSCRVCGKEAYHKSKLKQHVETHLEGFSHTCQLCGKVYRSRNVLRMHTSRDHKNKDMGKDTKHGNKLGEQLKNRNMKPMGSLEPQTLHLSMQ